MLLLNSKGDIVVELLHMSDLKNASLANAGKIVFDDALIVGDSDGKLVGIFLPDDIPFDGATAVAEN